MKKRTDPMGVRLERLFRAMRDPSSYRMLWSSMIDQFVEPETPSTVLEGCPDQPRSGTGDGACDAGIPKSIFQTWKTRENLPKDYAYWRATFVKHNLDFQHIIWDDTDNREFINSKFPWFIDIYDQYPREIFRADLIRFFFLYTFGGFYADLDTECLRSLEDLRNLGDVLIGRMGNDPEFEHAIPNAVMASRPRQLFWLVAIALAKERFLKARETGKLNDVGPEEMTGPVLLKAVVEYYTSHSLEEIMVRSEPVLRHFKGNEYQFGEVRMLPSSTWYPLHWNNPAHQVFRRKMFKSRGVLGQDSARRRFHNSYVVTYWSHSW